MKKLFLLRHAKSSWENESLSDHDRPLAPRGIEASTIILPKVVQSIKESPELIISSSANRAYSTAENLLNSLKKANNAYSSIELKKEPFIYGAGLEGIVNFISKFPKKLNNVMLVGHNPDFEDVASWLCGCSYDGTIRMPTAALAVIDFNITDWEEVKNQHGVLNALVYPKLFKKMLIK